MASLRNCLAALYGARFMLMKVAIPETITAAAPASTPLRIVNRVYLKARKTASNARPVAMIVGQINCPGLSISARHKMTVIRLSRPKETFFPTFPTANR